MEMKIMALTEAELKTIAGGNGCGIDPNGNPTSTTDNGCGMDPNGNP